MKKLNVRIVIEILGRPPEHVKSSLSALIDRLEKEKGVKINERKIHDPIPAEGSDNLFTTFAEVFAELESIENYLGIIFAYMPSNIEIISPEQITLTNADLNHLGNKLALRLHDYDNITKRVVVERDTFLKKLQEVAPYLFKTQEVDEAKEQKKQKKSKKKAKKK